MSLRAIHIVFIVASIVLAAMVTVWGVVMFTSERGSTGHLLFAAGSAVSAALMSAYAVRFVRKTRELGIE